MKIDARQQGPLLHGDDVGVTSIDESSSHRPVRLRCSRALRSAWLCAAIAVSMPGVARADFLAGAAIVDVTPTTLPVLVNGGMMSRSIEKVRTRINARALAVSDGNTKVVIVVVDSCMMPRPLLDEAKLLAEKRTGVAADHILISATHTHTAPSVMGALGTDADKQYVPFLVEKLAEAIATAVAKLEPAQIGFTKTNAAEFTALRRWIRRPDRIDVDPFGNRTVRANMHAARNYDNVTGESGPEDPDLSLISIQSRDGKPLAVLANFSMHYFSDRDISADYFGRFCDQMQSRVASGSDFVAIMSHGCSGDIWRRDYSKPEGQRGEDQTIDDYANKLLDVAMSALKKVEYSSEAPVAMAERRLMLRYRVPDLQRLEWAQEIVEAMGERNPKTREEVYAREQVILNERQQTEIVLQGLRIGDIGIATTPNETYAITGLKIKAASPLKHNIVIELANGGDGYIPPPEQHLLGGYNTWAARSAGLEVEAEPKIVETDIELLEHVSGKTRRAITPPRGPAANAIAALKPAAWWRLDEFTGPIALDSSGHNIDATYEPQIAFYLEGPHSEAFSGSGETNRAAMFAGDRLRARIANIGDTYSVSMWFWNGMPNEGREVSGWLFSRGRNHGLPSISDHLGIGGTSRYTGRLMFFHGADETTSVGGFTEIPRWQWNHLVFVRANDSVTVYLNGKPEIEVTSDVKFPTGLNRFFLGGRSDNDSNWEGRLDEIAIFDRALNQGEVKELAR